MAGHCVVIVREFAVIRQPRLMPQQLAQCERLTPERFIQRHLAVPDQRQSSNGEHRFREAPPGNDRRRFRADHQ
ncbi:MAG: hypothetical protein A3B67_14285 [Burkholderiales bacterium RIFCSPHIGHO2_02_FULL_66_10]|nr:MAG: hypothetical protein A3B67_14285 [Burkholderiales bacterium RIFCSPHIGHO2_02_FULL_66_10]